MEFPDPQHAVVALAAFLRRLSAAGGTPVPFWRHAATGPAEIAAAERAAQAVVGAAAPFATTSYARARLLRQFLASGLLTEDEARPAVEPLDVAQ